MKRFLALISGTLLCFCSSFVLGQTVLSSSVSSGPGGTHGTMRFPRAYGLGAPITGAPFSAEEVNEDLQTLADGTNIRRAGPGSKIYRDSMGRTRTESKGFRGVIALPSDIAERPTIVEIDDPVAHVRYIFDLEEAVAHRQKVPVGNSRPGPHFGIGGSSGLTPVAGTLGTVGTVSTTTGPSPATRDAAARSVRRQGAGDDTGPQRTTEKLGNETIEGIPAEGTRHTTTWPVGSMGNDRPITRISENWFSPELKEVILSKSEDQRSGEHTRKLVNISQSEPDPSLFEPPPGYTVKDEKGEFKIEWGTGR